jgi:anthranilate synthase/aminodeoxychorismate synthase-like glutamine amidotransferase
MILVIDNYDSFTFNLVQAIGRYVTEIEVRRNDQSTLEDLVRLGPSGIVVSPGPGRPENAGITLEAIRVLGRSVPLLGVCLGHQAIGLAFGGCVVHAPSLMHGRTSLVHHGTTPLYEGVCDPFVATRYHSLVVAPENLPEELQVTAWTDDGVIMGIRHRDYPIDGVQFPPESIMTTEGERILRNWMEVHQCR